jgi:hypothetical protein
MKLEFFITLGTTIFLIIVLILYFNTDRTESVQAEPVYVQEMSKEEYNKISNRKTWTYDGIIWEINLTRSERHLPPLLRHLALGMVAYEYNVTQMANGEIAHYLWEDGESLDRLFYHCKNTREEYRRIAGSRIELHELLAQRFPNTETIYPFEPTNYCFAHVYDISKPHCDKVYHPDATFIGFSVLKCKHSNSYFIATYIIMEK